MVQSLALVGGMSILLWGMQNGLTYADFADSDKAADKNRTATGYGVQSRVR